MKPIFGRKIVAGWLTLPWGARYVLGLIAVVVVVFLFFRVTMVLQSEHRRLAQREREAAVESLVLQETLDQWRALQARKPLPTMASATMREAVSTSLQRNSLALAVTSLDGTKLRLQGDVDFDRAMTWLGQLLQAERLTVTAMTATRGAGTAHLELELSAVQE